MIKRATKKPVTIEYVEWTGENLREVYEFIDDDSNTWIDVDGVLVVGTSEGPHLSCIGDVIIKDVEGYIELVRPEIFAKTYTIDSE